MLCFYWTVCSNPPVLRSASIEQFAKNPPVLRAAFIERCVWNPPLLRSVSIEWGVRNPPVLRSASIERFARNTPVLCSASIERFARNQPILRSASAVCSNSTSITLCFHTFAWEASMAATCLAEALLLLVTMFPTTTKTLSCRIHKSRNHVRRFTSEQNFD